MTTSSVFVFLLALLVVGRVLAARRMVPEGAPETLNVVALYVCTPASILLNAPGLTFERDLAGLVAVPWVILAASVVAIVPLARVLGLSSGARACLLTVVPMGNTAFLGYVLVPTLAGADTLKYAVAYDQFGSFLILVTYGLFVMASHAGQTRPTALQVLRRIVLFPPFLALVAGLTIMPAAPPPSLARPLELLSGALLPIVALALGMQLRLARPPREERAALAIGVVGKLVVAPLVALGLCAALGLHGEIRAVAVVQSAMPTMMTTGALLAMAGLAPDLAAAIVGASTLLSMLTLPAWGWLLR